MGCHSIFPPDVCVVGRECFDGSQTVVRALCTCLVSTGWLWGVLGLVQVSGEGDFSSKNLLESTCQ